MNCKSLNIELCPSCVNSSDTVFYRICYIHWFSDLIHFYKKENINDGILKTLQLNYKYKLYLRKTVEIYHPNYIDYLNKIEKCLILL